MKKLLLLPVALLLFNCSTEPESVEKKDVVSNTEKHVTDSDFEVNVYSAKQYSDNTNNVTEDYVFTEEHVNEDESTFTLKYNHSTGDMCIKYSGLFPDSEFSTEFRCFSDYNCQFVSVTNGVIKYHNGDNSNEYISRDVYYDFSKDGEITVTGFDIKSKNDDYSKYKIVYKYK